MLSHEELIQLVIRHVDVIGPYARSCHAERGRGVVLAHIELLEGSTCEAEELRYVPLDYIPSGDDFRPVIASYEPSEEFVILVGGMDGDGECLAKLRFAESRE